jgi:hypothetical protein
MVTDREALTAAIAERYRDMLPADEFAVEVEGAELHVKALGHDAHAGSTISGPGFFALHVPLPASLRLHAFFDNEARALQEFVSRIRHQPWPSAGADPHVRITNSQVRVWYGTADEAQATLRWRPFDREQLSI